MHVMSTHIGHQQIQPTVTVYICQCDGCGDLAIRRKGLERFEGSVTVASEHSHTTADAKGAGAPAAGQQIGHAITVLASKRDRIQYESASGVRYGVPKSPVAVAQRNAHRKDSAYQQVEFPVLVSVGQRH